MLTRHSINIDVKMLALLAIIGVLPPVIGYQARELQYLCSVGKFWSEYERIQRLGQG